MDEDIRNCRCGNFEQKPKVCGEHNKPDKTCEGNELMTFQIGTVLQMNVYCVQFIQTVQKEIIN